MPATVTHIDSVTELRTSVGRLAESMILRLNGRITARDKMELQEEIKAFRGVFFRVLDDVGDRVTELEQQQALDLATVRELEQKAEGLLPPDPPHLSLVHGEED